MQEKDPPGISFEQIPRIQKMSKKGLLLTSTKAKRFVPPPLSKKVGMVIPHLQKPFEELERMMSHKFALTGKYESFNSYEDTSVLKVSVRVKDASKVLQPILEALQPVFKEDRPDFQFREPWLVEDDKMTLRIKVKDADVVSSLQSAVRYGDRLKVAFLVRPYFGYPEGTLGSGLSLSLSSYEVENTFIS